MDGRISNFAQIASLRRYTLSEGRGRGLDVIDCDNGKIRFLLNVSQALDVMQLYHEGQNVSFLSKNAFEAREIPFARRFEGGMIYTCGLDNVGRREGYELHGSLHNTPAEILRATCTEEGITVEAVIRETALFGQNLALYRKISVPIGAEHFVLEDTLVNEGYTDAEYSLLYHINVGYPLLDEGCEIVADIADIEALGAWAEENEAQLLQIRKPTPDEDETCYYLTLNRPEISLANRNVCKKLTVRYSEDTLPCFLLWKSMASGDYALGLEPCTSEVGERLRPVILHPEAHVSFRVTVGIEKA